MEEINRVAALRWIAADNVDGQHGLWGYEPVKKLEFIPRSVGRVESDVSTNKKARHLATPG